MSKIYLLILIFVITISSCDNEVIPKSEFELINADLNTPYLTNQFISVLNKSDNGLEYFWDFGNGAYSNDFEPKISYEESGFYTIKLSVKSSTGTISSFEKSIEVKDRVAKSFKAKALNDLKRKYFKIKTESDFICSNSHCLKNRKVQV